MTAAAEPGLDLPFNPVLDEEGNPIEYESLDPLPEDDTLTA